jgi:hypothetical protein
MSKAIKQLLKTITPDQADEIRSVNYKLWRAIFDDGIKATILNNSRRAWITCVPFSRKASCEFRFTTSGKQ